MIDESSGEVKNGPRRVLRVKAHTINETRTELMKQELSLHTKGN